MNKGYEELLKLITFFSVLFLSINYTYGLFHEKGTMFDESLVSALAFSMLIITALMQNKDLRMQREEMEESRKVQELQKNEMASTNNQLLHNIKQTKFFELQRTKQQILESLLNDASYNLLATNERLIQRYLEIMIENLDDKHELIDLYEKSFIPHIGNNFDSYVEEKKRIVVYGFDRCVLELKKDFVYNIKRNPKLYINKFLKFNHTKKINLDFFESKIGFDFLNEESCKITTIHYMLHNYHEQIVIIIDKDKELHKLYNSLLTREEKLFHNFMNKSVNMNILETLYSRYN